MSIFNKFYENKDDPQLLKDIIGSGMFWYLRKLIFDDFEITLNLFPYATEAKLQFISFTDNISDNELIGFIVCITNDNGYGRYFEIIGNENMDGIGLSAYIKINIYFSIHENYEYYNFTNGNNYFIKVWSNERFIGYTESAQLTDIPEYKNYTVNIPEKKLKKKLVRRFPNVQMSVRTTGRNIYEAMLGLTDVNPSSTEKYHLRVGSNSPASGRYYIHGKDQVDQGGHGREIILFNTYMFPNGTTDIETDADTWLKVPLFIDIMSEMRNSDNENYYELVYEKPIDIYNNLISYYRFDTNANDNYNGNDGVVTGATLTAGKINNCYLFTGTNNIDMGNVMDFGLDSFSISFWYKLPSHQTNIRYIISKTVYTGQSMTLKGYSILVVQDDKIYFKIYDGIQQTYVKTGVLPFNEFIHIVAICDRNSVLKIYYNNNLIEYSHILTGNISNSGNFIVGYNGFYSAIGYVDELSIWNKVLSEKEIEYIYNEGQGRQLS